jgi:hypothetical protein
MSVIQQVLMGLIAVGMVTTLILPGRMTDRVIGAAGSFFNGGLKVAMGRA